MSIEITKPNDIFVAAVSNPEATTYDLMSSGIKGENTSLFSKDDYKNTAFVKERFTDDSGKFNDKAFNDAYTVAQHKFYELTSDQYAQDLNKIVYSPFDITRPSEAKTFDATAIVHKEFNTFKELHGWTGIDSVDENPLSLREIAQLNKVYDPETDTWSENAATDFSFFNKFFGDTLVYAQWDEDGEHIDVATGRKVGHSKGDWKVDDGGDLFLEKLGSREVYGKQVVNPYDILTVDGSTMDKFNFLDSDGREKSMVGTIFKTAFQIAPYFIPNIGALKGAASIRSMYGALNAGVGFAGVLPTFYKSLEGLLLGNTNTALTRGATNMEGWMAKYTTPSTSDEGQGSIFSFEQMASMVGSIFSQIHEQRAAASLSKYVNRADPKISARAKELGEKLNTELIQSALTGQIDIKDIPKLSQEAAMRIPELRKALEAQSQMSKALSLAYMAMTSSGNIYGEALAGGYDRRTAGFAALASAAGQYSLMMNNQMGEWFLDKTTGFNANTNNALMSKAISPHLKKAQKAFNIKQKGDEVVANKLLGKSFRDIRKSIHTMFTTPSQLKEAMWKNSLIEGVEEVTEQAVEDGIKGIIDFFSYMGIGSKGSFGGFDNVFSKEGFNEYIANFAGGVLGGSLFEFHRQKIEPRFSPGSLDIDTKKSLYRYISEGKAKKLIKMVDDKRGSLGNSYLTPLKPDGSFQEVNDANRLSQGDLVADNVIGMIEQLDEIFNRNDLKLTDEEIIKKTIQDEIIIKKLKATTAKDSSIGIEGLVLEDFSSKMVEIADLELNIAEASKKGDQKQVDLLQKKLKKEVDYVNEILEGKKGAEYFGKSGFFLNSKINSSFINLDKNTYTQETYGVDYSTIPLKGEGITQESINKEWREFLDSKDLRKDLDKAYNVYLGLEKFLNGYIANYTESGYIEEHKKTLNNLFDLKRTIQRFNVEVEPEKKEQLFAEYIELNSIISKKGGLPMSPWIVIQDDIYDSLEDLNLIKKVEYVEDANGEMKEILVDFTPEELNTIIEEGDPTTVGQHYKREITKLFQEFPSKLISADEIITNINSRIASTNSIIQGKIQATLADPTIADKDAIIEDLQKELVNIRILDSFSIDSIKSIVEDLNTETDNIHAQHNVTQESLHKYAILLRDGYKGDKSFENLIEETNKDGKKTVEELNQTELKALVDSVDHNTKAEALAKLNEQSSNSNEIILENIERLEETDLDPDVFTEIKEKLDPFLREVSQVMVSNNSIMTDGNHEKAVEDIKKEKDKAKLLIEDAKPDLFKMNNRALDLAIEELNSGNMDQEAFLFAQDLFNEDVVMFLSKVFPELGNLDYKEAINFVKNIPEILNRIKDRVESDNSMGDEDYDEDGEDTLPSVISNYNITQFLEDQALYIQDGNYSDILVDLETMEFVKKYVPKDWTVMIFEARIQGYLQNFNRNKHSKKILDKYIDATSKPLNLKSNSLYDFIRNFTLTLNSNPNNGVSKVFDILQKEENLLRSASKVSDYSSSNVRESDVNQAIDVLGMIKSVVYAMSTTETDYSDPIGFIAARQDYASKYDAKSDVLGLKTISSDVAALMAQDIELLESKLKFLKELGMFNSSKPSRDQEIIRVNVQGILLDKWRNWIKNMNVKFAPIDEIEKILDSEEEDAKKLMDIETMLFLHNQNHKEEALEAFLVNLTNVDSSKATPINKEMKVMSDWDLATYVATILSISSKDFFVRSLISLNGEFNKAPFFTQEFVTRMVKASKVNPKLFAHIYKIKQKSSNTDLSFVTTVLGNAGTGKTSAVFGLALEHFKQTNKTTSIWGSAPSQLSSDGLKEAVENSTGMDGIEYTNVVKRELFNKLNLGDIVAQIEEEVKNITNNNFAKQYVKLSDAGSITFTEDFMSLDWMDNVDFSILPNLLLIDEVTHYSFFEMKMLNEISVRSFDVETGNFMGLITAGDTSQLGWLAEVNDKHYNYNVETMNAIAAPKLWASIRSANVQQRDNVDLVSGISAKVSSIYSENYKDLGKAEKEAIGYLTNIDTMKLNLLTYYEDDSTINGTKIISKLDKQVLSPIVNAVKKDATTTVGILTEGATDVSDLSEELRKTLTDAGLITVNGEHPNLHIFNTGNIQGSEIDYFIFDIGLTTKYDKIRDRIKAFYTYMSRAKVGSIVIDPENLLETDYKIYQGEKESTTQLYEVLTEEVIKNLKAEKKAYYERLVGENAEPSEHDNFKWKKGEPIYDVGTQRFVGDAEETLEEPDDNKTKKLEDKSLKEGFKAMMYSFYNNPGAKVTVNAEGKISGIESDVNNMPTDLNINGVVKDPETAQEIVSAWARAKNYILHNLSGTSIITTEYQRYFNKIFAGMQGASDVEVEIVMTATKMDKAINTPLKKKGFDNTLMIGQTKPFINLSAKLTWDEKTHYITLATLGTQEKILAKAEEYNVSKDAINTKFGQIEESLKTNSFVEYEIDIDDVSFLTSTVLKKIYKTNKNGSKSTNKVETFSIGTLEEDFPGLNVSGVKFIPHTRQSFVNLFDSYVFGERRAMTIVVEDGKEKFSDPKIEARFLSLRNKPYVVVSFDNDLDGGTGLTTKARIVMVGANKRGLTTLKQEVSQLLEERNNDMQANSTKGSIAKISDSLNVKTEMVLNRNDILEVLIKWGTTKTGNKDVDGETYLDLLTKELPFKLTDNATGNTTSVFEVFSRFSNTGKQLTSERLKEVIEQVKKSIAKHKDSKTTKQDIKKEIINKLERHTGWHWSFFNIFGYEDIINSYNDKAFNDMFMDGMMDEDALKNFNEDTTQEAMKNILASLLEVIKDMDFYYSIPIKPGKVAGTIEANPLMNSDSSVIEFFGEKFHINVAPESSMLMFDIKGFNNLGEPKKTKKTTVTPGPTAPGSTTTDESTNTDTDEGGDGDTTNKSDLEKGLDALFDHDEMRTAPTIFMNIIATNADFIPYVEEALITLMAEEEARGVPKTFQNRFRHILGEMRIGLTNGIIDSRSLHKAGVPKAQVLGLKRQLETLLLKKC